MHKYRLISKKGEGTFSEVLKAQCIKTGQYVAIKCMKNTFESIDQVNNLREIQALRRLSPHPNIITLLEVLYDQPSGRLALVFELMDMNIYELIRERRHYLGGNKVRGFMYQLCRAMDHMHRNGIFHRDIKPENILIHGDVLKLADFGSCRGIYSKQPFTEYISTRWYRAPECLLTDGYYSYKMDIWGLGCVFFEIMSLYPLFPGTNELDQVGKIHQIMGTPSPELLSNFQKKSSHMDFNFPAQEGTGLVPLLNHVSADCVDLLNKLLQYKPDDRLSARQALRHPHFRELRDAEKRTHQREKQRGQGSSTHHPAPASPAQSNHSGMTARSTDRETDGMVTGKKPKGTVGGGKQQEKELPVVKDMQKTHSMIASNATGSAQSKSNPKSQSHVQTQKMQQQMEEIISDRANELLPPIGKVSLMIDTNPHAATTKKLHKANSKPAAALQRGGKKTGARKKDPVDFKNLSVYNSK
jgi:renal tumor antigen